MADEVFLKLKGIKKSFGGVHALNGVDLEIRRGEIHCLAGENGCGKSTLIKAISGVHRVDEGEIWIEGKLCNKMNPIDAINKGIQVIYQDFAVFPNLTVAENIALNGEVKNKAKLVNWKEIHRVAAEAMAQVGAEIDPDVKLEQLSVANKQMVAICRAIINGPHRPGGGKALDGGACPEGKGHCRDDREPQAGRDLSDRRPAYHPAQRRLCIQRAHP
mgnify:CR=1 FL=1